MTQDQVLEWNYTDLAAAYDHRPDYHAGLVRHLLSDFELAQGDTVLDVGAGTGKLTGLLADSGATVVACEPNAEMLRRGADKGHRNASWVRAVGESLPIRTTSIALVCFGSSFNVLPAGAALDESARVLQGNGHWLALWNHRDLDDSLQREVEEIIRRHVPAYDYGRRRVDPSHDVAMHASFEVVRAHEQRFVVDVAATDWIAAWQSHATLQRQAGAVLPRILAEVHALIDGAGTLSVPYFTRAWTARRAHA